MKKQLRKTKLSFLHCLVVLIALTGSMQLQGQSLVEYNASAILTGATTIPVSTTAANMTATAITNTGLTSIAGGAGLLVTNTWPLVAINTATAKYLKYTLTANSGYRLNLNGATFFFDCQRDANGPTSVGVYTSVDNYTTAVGTATLLNTNNKVVAVTFSNVSFNNLTTIQIRIYAGMGANNSGRFNIHDPLTSPTNIRITGGSVASCIPVISTISSNTPICNGSTLNLSSSATSVVTPITYSWTGPNSFSSSLQNPSNGPVTSADAGTYTLTATNSCGTSGASTTVVAVNTVVVSSSSQSNVTCNGGSNGSASVNVATGGVAPYTYDWTPSNPIGDGTTAVTSLTAGSYTCTAMDANGCQGTSVFTISEPAVISSSNSQSNVSCFSGSNGSATVSVSGGTPGYTYSWSPSGGTAATASSLSTGSYTCSITDANGCSGSETFSITSPTAISLSASSVNETCPGVCDGIASVNASGGAGSYTYSWSPSGGTAASATSRCGGTYTCAVTDANGCSTSTSTTVGSNNCTGSTQLVQNYTNMLLSNYVYITTVTGATNYQYEFSSGPTVVATYIRGNTSNYLYLGWITGLTYNATYNVRVRSFVGSTWGAYGAIKTVTMQTNIPVTQLSSGYCGAVNQNMSQYLYTNQVVGATNYQYQFTDVATSAVINYVRGSSSNYVQLQWVSGLAYGHSYNVQVRSFVGTWSAYGANCTVGLLSSIPLTSLAAGSCGASVAGMSTQVNINPVAGATDYQYEFTNLTTSVVTTWARGNNSTYMHAGWVTPALTANTNYSVKVRAKVGGVYEGYGSACTLFIGTAGRFSNPDLATSVDFTVNMYPNPIVENVAPTLNINGADGHLATIKVIDITGKEISSYQVQVDGNEFNTTLTDFPTLSKGMYFMSVTVDDNVQNLKFIVE